MVDDVQIEEFASNLPNYVYPVFELYGKCERIVIVNGENRNNNSIIEEDDTPMLNESAEADRNSRLYEKADLEVHEKEIDNSLNNTPSGSRM